MRTEPKKKGKEGPFKELKTFLEFSGFFPGVTKQTLLIRFLTNFHEKVSIHFFTLCRFQINFHEKVLVSFSLIFLPLSPLLQINFNKKSFNLFFSSFNSVLALLSLLSAPTFLLDEAVYRWNTKKKRANQRDSPICSRSPLDSFVSCLRLELD